MNLLDLLILLAAGAAAVGGWRLGFLARAASWAGLAIGVVLAVRLLPVVTDELRGSGDTRLLFVTIAVLVGGAFIGQAIGLILGTRLHLALPVGGARRVDRALGAIAGAVGVMVAVWLLVPTAANARGWPAEQTRRSSIARTLNDWLPDPPRDLARALRNSFPQVFVDLR
ncbi:MAG: CvpA family protein, partial [Acidimicrobiales bacterium]